MATNPETRSGGGFFDGWFGEGLDLLNVVLKGLKQNTSNGYNACDVCNDNVIMFNLNSFACSIASKVIWLSSPSKINKCLLLKTLHLELTC
jgi:hypothetical protein